MKQTTCKICGRPLRHTKGFWRWISGPYCSGKDVYECMEIQTAMSVKRLIEEYDERQGDG